MAITTRTDKGAALTHAEMDTNFTDLRDGIGARTPAASADTGIKVGDNTADDYGWHDMHGFQLQNPDDPLKPAIATIFGTIQCYQYAEGEQTMYRFHIPHDYKLGTDLFIHAHWLHNSSTITGGSCTWGFEVDYAKGHQQGVSSAFSSTTKTVSILQSVGARYEHMVAEGALSISGGSGTQLDTADIEPDGLILCRFFLDSNDITDSVLKPDPFVFFVDVHYQSTGVPTQNRTPNFYGA